MRAVSPQCLLTFWTKLSPINPTPPLSASSLRLPTKVSVEEKHLSFFRLDKQVKGKITPKGTLWISKPSQRFCLQGIEGYRFRASVN